MKILIRNSDKVVIYAQDDLILDTEAHGNGWRDPNFSIDNATLTEADLPIFWSGAVWTYIDGVWTVVDFVRHNELVVIEEARQAAKVRQTRNDKLKECDWTQLIDSLADKVSWDIYRQELRDVTKQVTFPFNISWPKQP